jgi:hypothetical protein
MNDITTIKVSKSTLERLHRIVGELTKQKGKRITLEDAIVHLLEKNELKEEGSSIKNDIEKDRKAFIKLIEKGFFGGSPEDYKEYDFEDIGG